MKKRTNLKHQTHNPADTRPDPLTQAFKEYWRNVDAGKNHTNAALYVLRDYGIEMNDKQEEVKSWFIFYKLKDVESS